MKNSYVFNSMQVIVPLQKNEINWNSESLTTFTLASASSTALSSLGTCLKINYSLDNNVDFILFAIENHEVMLIPILLADFPRPFCVG